jgi:hypothetical protein
MELVEGPVSFRREGQAYLKPMQTVMNGVAFGRPYQHRPDAPNLPQSPFMEAKLSEAQD